MNFNFEFDHSNISSIRLQENGIRSLREIEEVVQGESFAEELSSEIYGSPIFLLIGFTTKSKPLKVAFSLGLDYKIITLQAKIASVYEIKKEFCKHCK